LRDVTVLGVDERLRQPDEVCVDLQHPWIHRPIAIPEGSGAPFDAVIKVGHAPEVPSGASRTDTQNIAATDHSPRPIDGYGRCRAIRTERRFWRGVVRRSITLRGARDCHFCIARLLDATRLSGVARVPSGPRRWLTRQPRPGCATPSVEEVDSPVH
jgi:hypothetical protein